MRRLVRRLRVAEERGAVLVLVVLLMVSLLGMAAVVLDLATLRQDRAKDRSTADVVAAAAATNLAAPGSTMVTACTDGWDYFRTNTSDAGTVTQPPPCSNSFSTNCDPTVKRTATGVSGPYTVTIVNPVPDGDSMLTNPDVVGGHTQGFNEDIDGPACQRIGIDIVRTRTHAFASVLGVYGGSTESRSVARAVARFSVGGVIALVILDQTQCNVFTTSGQAKVVVHPNGQKPGYITVDSSATDSSTCNNSGSYALDASGTQNSKIIAEPSAESGEIGVIRQFALSPGQGIAHAYDPTDIKTPCTYLLDSNGNPIVGGDTGGTCVSPKPTPASQRITRNPLDWRWNCQQNGRDGLVGTTDDCKFYDTQQPYLNQLKSLIGVTGVPSGYSVYPRPGNSGDSCHLPPSAGNITLGSGDWYVDCPGGFDVANTFKFVDSNVVFAGGVDVNSSGSLEVNQSAGNGDAAAKDGFVYIRSGDLTKGAQSTLKMTREFVYLANGKFSLGGGAGPLTWTAPTHGDFEDLALWSESTQQHDLGGQSNVTVEGVFFTPNANPFNFSGQGGQTQANAQFITRKLVVTGQGTLVMTPNPDRAIILPAWGAALIR